MSEVKDYKEEMMRLWGESLESTIKELKEINKNLEETNKKLDIITSSPYLHSPIPMVPIFPGMNCAGLEGQQNQTDKKGSCSAFSKPVPPPRKYPIE